MNSVVIRECGTTVIMETRFKRKLRGFLTSEKDRYFVRSGMSRIETANFTDREAEIEFFRWASILNEVIVMQVYRSGHPKAGELVNGNECPAENETHDEEKTIYEWGKELAELESTAMKNDDPRIQRWHHIVQMFGDAKITWRGGPKWWRLI